MPLGSGDDLTNAWEGDWGKSEREERERERRKEDEGLLPDNGSFPLIPPLPLPFPFTKRAIDKIRNK